MDHFLQDLRYAVRSLRRTPGFTFTVIAVMALGIGVNSLIYTVVRGILFADLPYPHPERVVAVQAHDLRRSGERMSMSLPDLRDVIERSKTLRGTFAANGISAVVSTGVEALKRDGAMVTPGLPVALGVEPRLGRWFTPAECRTGANLSTVVLSDRAWREELGADPHVLGRTIHVNGRPRTVVGVMPPGFRYPETTDYFVPLAVNDTSDSRGAHYLNTVARLAPGATLAQAQAELGVIARELARLNPKTNANITFVVSEYLGQVTGSIRPIMLLLLLAVTFVLLIACANVANLMLARAATRQREVGVRIALGASRGRLVAQMLTEALLLSCAGGAIGILLGAWGMRVTLASIPEALPFWMRFDLDPKVVAAVAGVSVLAGIAFGLAPALHASSGDLLTPLREGTPGGGEGPGRRRMRNTLVVAEIALAVVLLIGSGLMVRSFLRMEDQRFQLRTDGVLTGSVLLPIALYPGDAERDAFTRDFRRELLSLPGVHAAGAVLNLHLGNNLWRMTVAREGVDADRNDHGPVLNFNALTPGYLDAVGLPLRRGRDFTEADVRNSLHVSLVNEDAARVLWPGQDPIGKRWSSDPDDPAGWYTVVGVVAPVSQRIRGAVGSSGEVLVPSTQTMVQQLTWTVRGDAPPTAMAATVRRLLHQRDPNLAFADVRSLAENVRIVAWEPRLYAQLMGVFSLVALVIAALGIHGVMAYSVAQRTREIGIRMALGAARADVQRLVVGHALRLTLLGAGIGLALAYALTRFMASQLFGVRPDDPPTFVGVTLILALSSAAAAWLPTARAVRVDPVVALRHE